MHPRQVLLGAQAAKHALPVCDHYSGVESRMVKSLQLQEEFIEEFGVCVFDVTLDCEDGAPIGGELEHAELVASLVKASKLNPLRAMRRVGARVHAVDHPAFGNDIATLIGKAGADLSYLMMPKIDSLQQLEKAVTAVDAALAPGVDSPPLHVLIESPLAIHNAFLIAAHPRVESLSFGLMDFVSSHGGAIPWDAMGSVGTSQNNQHDQFHHPLVVRAKTELASACHAYGKVPSHCVVTEIHDSSVLAYAAKFAARSLGYSRMWSIHPSQIRPILHAFAPDVAEIDLAAEVIARAHEQQWAPIALQGRLHDRASYRYFWQTLERAYQTGIQLPATARSFFDSTLH
jgi:citrate lyase subunit beta / citryl-CoA lyase